jgi:hypothetical protein
MNLREVNSDEYFFLSDGRPIKSIRQLASMLVSMDNGTFSYHANGDKNDFANWIKYVIKDAALADSIMGVTDKVMMSKMIKEAISKEEHPVRDKINEKRDEVKSDVYERVEHVKDKVADKIESKKESFKEKKEKIVSKVKKQATPKIKKAEEILDKYDDVSSSVKKITSNKSSKKSLSSAKHLDYKDDFDVDKMISEINLGKQRDMLSRISSRISRMNDELEDIKAGKKKATKPKATTRAKSSPKKSVKKTAKKTTSKPRTARSDKLHSKYKSLISDDVKKRMKLPKAGAHSRKHSKPSFEVIDKSDNLRGINDQYETDGDDSGDSQKMQHEHHESHPVRKQSGGFFSRLFKSVDVEVSPSVKAMETEKKGQEAINILQNPHININTVMDFMKGLLIGMILGMIFLLIF